ncbi:MAG TPA: TetR/AcrR family transcriptional regulator [Solirubrobacteraceae bacterium]|nr:TetR/AcrR family transcriptional regulator [Solirubrobacteraceae bacterium]
MAASASTATPLAHSRARMEDIQRARLLAAVAEVAVEQGAGNVTVAQIVTRAGVSRRTFYDLFNDCNDCLLAAIAEANERLTRHVLDHYDPQSPWARRLRSGLAAVLSFLDAEPGASLLLLAGSLGALAGAQEQRELILARIAAVVDEGRALTKAGPGLPPLTAEGVVGGALSVLHTRLSRPRHEPAVELLGPLMSMIVLPYLGAAAARRELKGSPPRAEPVRRHASNPLGGLGMRLTYRTVRVLAAVAANPGASNVVVARAAEVLDQGQMSKLLARLHNLGLIENAGGGAVRGAANAWALTVRGREVQAALASRSA